MIQSVSCDDVTKYRKTMANNETHDVQSKHSSLTEKNNDESKTDLQSMINNNSPDITLEDYKKTIDQSITSPSDATSESTQSDNAQVDAISSKIHPHNKPLKHIAQDPSLNEDDDNNNRQRTVSSSSSASSSSSDNQTSNIPYEILDNDEDDDDDQSKPTKETTNQIPS